MLFKATPIPSSLCIIVFLQFCLSDLTGQALPVQKFPSGTAAPQNALMHLPSERTHAGPQVFSLEIENHKAITAYMKYYKQGKWNYLQQCLKRSREYERHIRLLLDKYELPEELMYLPVVESAFKPYAYSHAGASGLWQFMMNSIYPYDMKVDSWRDERRDFWKSTDAALQKLAYNYKKTGDWLLALAAYNCGLGKVTRVMKTYKVNDFWTMWERKLLPRETISYIPSFLAVCYFAQNRGRFGLETNWETLPVWERIAPGRAVSLKNLAKRAKIPYTRLYNANAELKYAVTPPKDRSYKLKVPAEYAETVNKILADKKFAYSGFSHYYVRNGDTLSEIAHTFGTTVSNIMNQNPGLNPRALSIGRKLVIPSLNRVAGNTIKKLNVSQNYKVKQGDTLWDIAKSFGTTADNIARLNGLALNGIIKSGMILAIPGGS